MRKLSAIFLVVLLVATQTPVGQLLRLPVLVEHFAKHQRIDGFTVGAFLQEHYFSSHNDADLPEDEQLPFKRIIFYAIGFAIVPEAVEARPFVHFTDREKVFFCNADIQQQDPGGIFHPPRLKSTELQ